MAKTKDALDGADADIRSFKTLNGPTRDISATEEGVAKLRAVSTAKAIPSH
jgi:hypothetical protein